MIVRGSTKKYAAFTLLEMLLVLSILSVIGTLSMSAFGGLQSSVKISQEAENIAQDIRNLQRSSILLERESDEKWLYGLGIDFSSYESTGEYRIFKWCSQFDEYGANETRSDIPGYDDGSSLDHGNGYLPTTELSWKEECKAGDNATESCLVEYKSGNLYSTDDSLDPTLKTDPASETDITYILFEAVSGRAFFYDSSGELINYNTSNGEMDSSPVNFVIQLSTRYTIKTITVKNLSGKISIESYTNE